ncbi:MAG: hypothetical protein RLZZ519_1719 [Bacteroidota bacterium]|jgi:colanic acid/amylovoran biosynthesis glycosyltransferase
MSRKDLHIAVVSINRDKYSETFIQNAYDGLPGRKTLLYGGYLPTHFTHDWRTEGSEIPVAKAGIWSKKPQTEQERQEYNLLSWLKYNRVDLILTNYGPSGVTMLPVIRAMNLPLIVHFHGYDAYRSDTLGSYGRDYPALFAACKAVIAVSEDMKNQLLSLGAPPEKVHIYIYGVDESLFAPQPMPDGPLQFGFVGRFVEKKSPLLLIEAFARVHAQLPEVRLRCVGAGELLEASKALAQQLGVADAIEFLGILAPNAVARFISSCHALLLPSQSPASGDSEGTPLVILEAAMASRAVVTTRHGGIEAVVTDQVTGLLVTPGDVEGFAEAMLQLATDLEQVKTLGKNAAERAQRDFGNKSYHQKLIDLIRRWS